MKIAFMFPGQGAQVIGMGKDIYETYPEAQKIYEKANEILGKDITKLCFEEEQEQLNKTENAQIAIFITSLAIAEVLKIHGIKADMVTGLSLGEYSALTYAGMLSLEEGIKIIQKRGYYMGNYLPKKQYQMVAIIGMDSTVIEEACKKQEEKGNYVVPANYNYSAQTVISGEKEAVEEISKELKELGAKKMIALKTSGPFHTSKLEKAREFFAKELEKITISIGEIPVIRNIDGKIYQKEDSIKEILAQHMVSPVRFDKTIQTMKEQEIDYYIEVGPGKALAGFVKKEDKDAKVMNVNDLTSLEKVLEIVK